MCKRRLHHESCITSCFICYLNSLCLVQQLLELHINYSLLTRPWLAEKTRKPQKFWFLVILFCFTYDQCPDNISRPFNRRMHVELKTCLLEKLNQHQNGGKVCLVRMENVWKTGKEKRLENERMCKRTLRRCLRFPLLWNDILKTWNTRSELQIVLLRFSLGLKSSDNSWEDLSILWKVSTSCLFRISVKAR